ncbi:NAD(P)-dependent alcohol dehydrogenase [Halomonas salipaludis]|uniref:NAD(P)-dependent alcohol dehydrogenase n=1 Tax=Halomonas salipaludis TaxID=2032625 RepID=A0A2A2EQ67_9GAMM|nr:NAD(P)-dependent alcohol dehydrogenase [Halomonas salipaludis]PAU74798.1 NAD(P)-dependent alcohol dehydrogenase [Halomonas salipaludis]
MNIHAAVTRSPRAPFSLETLQLEPPRAGEILVRVVATGICHTDIAMRDQLLPTPQPVVLGHEGSGIVEQVGPGVAKVKPGDHVVMTFNSCGHCPSCFDGEASYCHEFFPRNFLGTRADGSSGLSKDSEPVHGNIFGQSSFASHALCHERNIVKVPQTAPLELLGPLACGVQTGAGAVLNALGVVPGSSIAVFGVGSVGLSAIMASVVAGATTIIAVDRHATRLAMAEELGATHVCLSDNPEMEQRIVQVTNDLGVDYALDTTGIAAVIQQAVAVLAPRGSCGILGASAPGSLMELDLAHMMSAGRSLRGIVEGDAHSDTFIPTLIRLYQQGRFPFDRLVTFYDFHQINQAIDDAEHGRVIKPIVRHSRDV